MNSRLDVSVNSHVVNGNSRDFLRLHLKSHENLKFETTQKTQSPKPEVSDVENKRSRRNAQDNEYDSKNPVDF